MLSRAVLSSLLSYAPFDKIRTVSNRIAVRIRLIF